MIKYQDYPYRQQGKLCRPGRRWDNRGASRFN